MSRILLSSILVLLWATTALAQQGPPIVLQLTPAKLPSPALRYLLLPDARLLTANDAAPIYHSIIELLTAQPNASDPMLLSDWHDTPIPQLPRDEVRKGLAAYAKVFELLDKAARCERCDWGLRERLRVKGIGTLLPEIQPLRECALLLSLQVHLEIADGRIDKAIATLRTGFALARNIGDAETMIHYLVGIAFAGIFEADLDLLLDQPATPNLYYALSSLPTPLFSMRKALECERISCIEGTLTPLAGLANLEAGNLTGEDLVLCVKLLKSLSKGEEDVLPPPLRRLYLAWDIDRKHDNAKKALIEAGRPRDKVEAMSPVQVALLHSLLEYDNALDKFIIWQNLPYQELKRRAEEVDQQVKNGWRDPQAPAVSLAQLMLPAIKKVGFAGARNERKIALLRTIEALRNHAALHDGQLPTSLGSVVEVTLPLDPVTGRNFEYTLHQGTATLRAPPPEKEKPNRSNCLVYELQIRR